MVIQIVTKKQITIDADELRGIVEGLRSSVEVLKGVKDDLRQNERQSFFLSEASIAILKYIAENQDKRQGDDDEGITKEEITRYMDEHELASRPTTLKTIEKLIKSEVILNAKRRQNARNRLTINPEYGFKEVEADLLVYSIKDVHARFQTLTNANNDLVKDLLNMIFNTIHNIGGMLSSKEVLNSAIEKQKNTNERIKTLIEGK